MTVVHEDHRQRSQSFQLGVEGAGLAWLISGRTQLGHDLVTIAHQDDLAAAGQPDLLRQACLELLDAHGLYGSW